LKGGKCPSVSVPNVRNLGLGIILLEELDEYWHREPKRRENQSKGMNQSRGKQ